MKYSVKEYLEETTGYEVEYIQGSNLRRVTNTNLLFDRDGKKVIVFAGDEKKNKRVGEFKDYKSFKTALKSKKKALKDMGIEFQKLGKCEWYFVSNSGGPNGRMIDNLKCDVHDHTKSVYKDTGVKVR